MKRDEAIKFLKRNFKPSEHICMIGFTSADVKSHFFFHKEKYFKGKNPPTLKDCGQIISLLEKTHCPDLGTSWDKLLFTMIDYISEKQKTKIIKLQNARGSNE